MGRLRSLWARGSWIDRVVVVALVLLALASIVVRPAWRAADPGLALAMATQGHRFSTRITHTPLERLDWLRDAWGRPALVVCHAVSMLEPDFMPHFEFLSAGPDGVVQTTWNGIGPTPLQPAGDDLLARIDMIWLHEYALFAPFLPLGIASTYRSARLLRPILSPARDLAASFALGVPACLALLMPGLILTRIEMDTEKVPLANGSVLLTLLGAVTMLVFGVRRHHAPAEPPPPPVMKTEADLEVELRALIGARPTS